MKNSEKKQMSTQIVINQGSSSKKAQLQNFKKQLQSQSNARLLEYTPEGNDILL
jgi:acetate kinase